MESSLSSPTIIEFNGLPGAGKTTICKELEKELSDRGVLCMTSPPPLNYLQMFCFFLNPHNLIIWLYVIDLLIRTRPFRIKKRCLGALTMVRYFQMYKSFSYIDNKQILIIDQGFLQGILSFFYLDKITQSNILGRVVNAFKKNVPSFLRVDCNCSILLAKERIRKRNRKKGRIDNMNDNNLIDALELQQKNITVIRDFCNANGLNKKIRIDTSCDNSINIEQIISFLHF